MKHSTILTATMITLGFSLTLSSTFAEPQPGDVFIEIGMPVNRTLQGDGGNSGVLSIPADIDLASAVRAEVAVEFANVHLGISGQAVRVNSHDWVPVPFPASVPALPCTVKPEGDQSHIYQMPVVTVTVPLDDFIAGKTNTCEFMTPDKGENHKSYTQIYGATFRIYYDPAKKAHATGKVTSPKVNGTLDREAKLSVSVQGKVKEVQYVGLYEDLDYNGDGIYREWTYTYRNGKLINALATATEAPFAAAWDTSWIPDQSEPMEIAARLVGADGVITMTPSIKGVTFARGDFSVELCKPTGILNGFSTCIYGKPMTIYTADVRNKTEYLNVTGPVKNLTDARLYFSCWRRASGPQMELNGVPLTDIIVEGKNNQYMTLPLRPVTALTAGTNTLILTNAKDGGTDIEWPGIQVLIQYNKPLR